MSNQHVVTLDTDEIWVALLLDVIRPMRFPARLLTRGLMRTGS
jgi:hypothetical protein